MFKIKSHNRYRSHDVNFLQNFQIRQELNKNKKSIIKENLIKSHQKHPLTNKSIQFKTIQLRKLRTINSHRNSINSCSQRFNHKDSSKLKFSLQKQKLQFQKFQAQISQIVKKQVQQLNKHNILKQLIRFIGEQHISPTKNIISENNQNNQKLNQILIRNQNFIQKFKIQINKNIGQNKRIIQQIQKQRKFRVLYENYLNKLEKQIKNAQIQYNTLLLGTIQNKFYILMISSNDIVSNGHVVALKKQNTEEMQKDLNKNTYMCLPKIDSQLSYKDENQKRKKSQKFIGKKGTLKKLNKILGMMESSKAFQSSQLSLYKNDEDSNRTHKSIFSIFKTQKYFFETDFPTIHQQNPVNIMKKKHSKKPMPRSGKIVSLKYMMNINQFYEGNFDEIVYELFKLYQSLNINIFSDFFMYQKQNKSSNKQNYFQYDEDKLTNQSQDRLQYIRKNLQKIQKFNLALQNKIENVQKNIHQTQEEIQKNDRFFNERSNKENIQSLEQSRFNSSQNDFQTFKQITNLLGIKYQNFDSCKQIEKSIQKLNQAIKLQTENLDCSTHNNLNLSDNLTQKSHYIETFSQFNAQNLENHDQNQDIQKRPHLKQMTNLQPYQNQTTQKRSYFKQMTKTEGNQRKFHQLIINPNQDPDVNFSKWNNKTSRSIYQNGKKSLDNIFQNLKVCNQYQKVFQRQQFQVQYSKQITKKKRVMFRRQAKIMPSIEQTSKKIITNQ